jgi:hypothetical protein
MMPSAGLRFKTYLLISMMVVFGPLGDVLLGKGMKQIGALADWTPAGLFRFFNTAFGIDHCLVRHRVSFRVLHGLHSCAFLGRL